MTTPQPPAGWYSDPDGSGGQRYWDGHAWTAHQARTPQPSPPPPPPSAPTDSASTSEPEDTSERGGAHRAPEEAPEPPEQPTGYTPPTSAGQPDGGGGGDRQLLMRYLAVCAALLAVLVAVAVYAVFFADDGSSRIGAFDDPTTTIVPTMTPTTTPGGGWGETPTETQTVTPTFPEPGEYTDGALAFSVDSVEVTPSVSSADFPVDKTAVGEFVVVHMSVTNTGDEPATFLGTFQKLTAGGEVYSIDDEATFYAGGSLAELNPGDRADVAVVFDVPPGTDPEAIELHADPLGAGVEVPLP